MLLSRPTFIMGSDVQVSSLGYPLLLRSTFIMGGPMRRCTQAWWPPWATLSSFSATLLLSYPPPSLSSGKIFEALIPFIFYLLPSLSKHQDTSEPLITLIFLPSCLPETRNKTLTEIQQLFSKKKNPKDQKSSVAA